MASQTRLAEYSLSLPQTQLDGFLAQIESISTNAPKVSASGSLAATQEQCKNALLKVSDFLFSKFGQNAALNRETFHSSFGLISTGQGQNSASIALHAKDIEAKLFDLRTTAFNMNVSVLFQYLGFHFMCVHYIILLSGAPQCHGN